MWDPLTVASQTAAFEKVDRGEDIKKWPKCYFAAIEMAGRGGLLKWKARYNVIFNNENADSVIHTCQP